MTAEAAIQAWDWATSTRRQEQVADSIYKRKHDKPVWTIKRCDELDPYKHLEFPVVITKDENIAYHQVWEVEEFDPGELSIEIKNMDGSTLLAGDFEGRE